MAYLREGSALAARPSVRVNSMRSHFAMIAIIGLVAPALAAGPAPDSAEFFEAKVRPVLVEHCYQCHSSQSKKLKAGLRVDGRAQLLKGGDNGPALVPGDPTKSKLIEAVRFANTEVLMPPKGKLPAAAVADLEAWVKAGAPWPNDATTEAPKTAEFDLAGRKKAHWAWAAVKPHQPPAVQNAAWPRDSIDRFILAKLEAANLKPVPPADPIVWLRRVTFAITGLPPTPAEIASFQSSALRDPQSAFESTVARLLATPAFGERWGRHWLDLVRYAESRGHEFEPDIPNAYQYRDYIVRALNADIPYNRLLLEHIAGDVLPDPRIDSKGTNESILGSGFWHLGEEVHSPVDVRQDQADRLDNRIDVMTKTFLGLTVSCARCHDHKFDAISTKDYYALFGLLEGSSYRQVRVDGWEQNRKVAAELEKYRLVSRDAKRSANPTPLKNATIIVDYANLQPGDWLPDDITFGPAPRPVGFVSVDQQYGKPIAHSEERTAAVYDHFWDGLKEAPGTGRDHGSLGSKPRAGFTIRTPVFTIKKKNLYYLVRGSGTAYAAVAGHTVIAGPLHAAFIQHFPDSTKYRWVSQSVAGYLGLKAHVELSADPKTDFAVAMVVQADDPPAIPPAWRLGPVEEINIDEMAANQKALAAKVVWESRIGPALFDGSPVDEQVFVRGSPKSLGDVVPHRSLEAFTGTDSLKHAVGSGRLELANQWIDPANPLVARVAVNRVWHQLFGRGIVASTDNFGVLGEKPTHPELLDTVAAEFVRDGWSLKRLIRRLVLSSSYRMDSREDPAAEKADPGNLLMHRFRLKRLEGEAIRDAMLQVSGRLDAKLGGPSVPIFLTPFLDGRGRPATGPLDGNGRRSLYLAVRRNFLSPFLLAFDTPIPFSTVGKRQVSNVPAQALILLNDPFVHEQANLWAKRVLKEPGTIDDRLKGMYLAAFGHLPNEDELVACRAFLMGHDLDPTKPRYLTLKEAIALANEQGNTDVKKWAELAHMLFNVKEFLYVR